MPDDEIHFSIEMSLREVAFPNMNGPAYRIKYAGRDGAVTEREIIVQWINSTKNKVWVTAFCCVRGKVRSFKADSIVSMVDSATGNEIANPVKYFRRLQDTL